MNRVRSNAPLFLVSASILLLSACSSGGDNGGDQYQAAMTLSMSCKDPIEGDTEVVAGDDIRFVFTLNNTSSDNTPTLNRISANDTLLGDIAAQLPDPLPPGESIVTINYTTSASGALNDSVEVVYQVADTSTRLTKTASTSCTVIYPDPNNPSEFPTQADSEEGQSGNNTPATAGALTIGETSYHTIYPVGDEDWQVVSLNAGTQYEFTVDNVSYNGLPKLELYASSDTSTPIDTSYGYFSSGFNPRILHTSVAGGTYYLKVSDIGISSYTLSSRIFSDGDVDSFSPHYDCNDSNPKIYPEAAETAGDGVDQSCSGYDWPVSSATDSFEPDGDFATAGSLPMFGGDPGDIIRRDEVYAETHTLHAGDVDVFKITVPAHSYYDVFDIETNGINFDSKLYLASDTTTPIDQLISSAFIYHFVDNSASATPTDFYLQITANNPAETGVYAIGLGDWGSDVDGDGHYTRSQGLGWDCDDSNAAIYAGADEAAPDDGIDSNCNGDDAT